MYLNRQFNRFTEDSIKTFIAKSCVHNLFDTFKCKTIHTLRDKLRYTLCNVAKFYEMIMTFKQSVKIVQETRSDAKSAPKSKTYRMNCDRCNFDVTFNLDETMKTKHREMWTKLWLSTNEVCTNFYLLNVWHEKDNWRKTKNDTMGWRKTKIMKFLAKIKHRQDYDASWKKTTRSKVKWCKWFSFVLTVYWM